MFPVFIIGPLKDTLFSLYHVNAGQPPGRTEEAPQTLNGAIHPNAIEKGTTISPDRHWGARLGRPTVPAVPSVVVSCSVFP